MKERLDSLLLELKRNTEKLNEFIECGDIESALDITTKRLAIFEEITNLVRCNHEYQFYVKEAILPYALIETNLTKKISIQKDNIAVQLLKFERMSKAEQAYRDVL
ncbi:hypothetical protein [uncultured Tolumonas sp.]|uniref:hypothetical protein n=1 Tax=uncultured Tolumonas sp. TaxID=263765 RepID=UPI002A0A31AB|nr:hypothetical protein [uncultured Tolumonas sp.]